MIIVEDWIDTSSQEERQRHLDLQTPCLERGGGSYTHRGVLAQFLNTSIPYGVMYLLCHACHNAKCSNPRHLYWGSPAENCRDKIANGAKTTKGRATRVWTLEERQKVSATLKGRPSNNKRGINGATKR